MEENNQNQQNHQNNTNINNENNPQQINIEERNKYLMNQIQNGQLNQYHLLMNSNQIIPNQNLNYYPENINGIPHYTLNQRIEGNPQINPNNLENMNNMNIPKNMNIPINQINPQINEQYYFEAQANNLRNPLLQGQINLEQLELQHQMELRGNKNIYDYNSNQNLYGIAFQNSNSLRLAVSSLEKSLNNKIEILELIDNELKNVYSYKMQYPCTKLLWSPKQTENSILASSSECIKLYNYDEKEQTLKFKDKLNNSKSKYCGALTSFDWNTVNDSLLGTASIDTTCTIWDLNKGSIKTQLIAHDKEVFDIQFGKDENTFISGGADGSVRFFDLRTLNHSTIIYETKGGTPINKIALNLQNSNLIAALSMDQNVIYIFDSRINSNVSMDELNIHKEPVTGIVWSPLTLSSLCSVSEDCNVIISNVQNERIEQNNNISYNAQHPINNVDWCKSFPEWIGITFKDRVQLLRK